MKSLLSLLNLPGVFVEQPRKNPGTEFRGAVPTLENKIEICACVFTFSVKLEKWSFLVADLPRKRKKCTEIKKAREGRAKLLFLLIKYANCVALSPPPRRRS